MGWSRNPDPFLRFEERIIKDESGCWLWQGILNTHGYAVFKIEARSVQVHRWAYETYKGCIPKGLVLDHRCNNRSCVNPDHLEPITVKENNARARTHCFQARHPLTEENIFITRSGARLCRRCREERRLKYRKRSDQFRQGMQESDTRKIFLVFAPDAVEDSPLIQALEELKQQGLILDFSESDFPSGK
jgi:hypothetical protein